METDLDKLPLNERYQKALSWLKTAVTREDKNRSRMLAPVWLDWLWKAYRLDIPAGLDPGIARTSVVKQAEEIYKGLDRDWYNRGCKDMYSPSKKLEDVLKEVSGVVDLGLNDLQKGIKDMGIGPYQSSVADRLEKAGEPWTDRSKAVPEWLELTFTKPIVDHITRGKSPDEKWGPTTAGAVFLRTWDKYGEGYNRLR